LFSWLQGERRSPNETLTKPATPCGMMLGRFISLFSLLLASASAASDGDRSIAAVQKVIQMMNDMLVKAKQEKMDEETAFAKFNTYCTMERASLTKAIAKDAEEIEMLAAEIGKLTSEGKILGKEIAKLGNDVEGWTADQKAQTAQRAKDNKEFLAEQQDYGESVSALERAIATLSKQNYDRSGAKAVLLQLSQGESLPTQAKQMVAALIGMMESPDDDGQGSDFMSQAAPEANAYEFQSGSIIDLLKRLRDDFSAKKGQCEKEEMNSLHAHNMIMVDLTNSVSNANEEIAEKTEEKERKAAKVGEDKKQLAATMKCKEEDEKTLSDLKAECDEKILSFNEKQQLRADEIEAIQQAVEILSSGSVSGNAEKHLALVATSLLQVGDKIAATVKSEGIRRRLREFLSSEGSRLHSRGILLLAEKIAADPFAKVKKLIDNMITRLLEEANEDAEHEGWCDKEMGQSKITRDKLTEEIDGLDAAVEDSKATILALGNEIATLTKEVADLDASVAEATQLRSEEKAKNAETVADTKEAQNAVQAATAIIKDFYAKASYGTALIQTKAETSLSKGSLLARGIIKMGTEEWKAVGNPAYDTGGGTMTMDDLSTATTGVDKGHKAGMQTFGESFQGQQDEAGGVVALLESILSDFANIQADTEASEVESQRAYKEFMNDAKRNRAVKSKKIEMDTSDKAAAEAKLRDDIADLKSTQDELLAADRYHAKLVPQCIDQGMTWDERVKAREEEIASLKEALGILSSADIETSAL